MTEQEAYAFVESRLWPDGPVCPHCGSKGRAGALRGGSTRIGVYKCYACRKPFTVKVGTIFESSHVPLHHWLAAIAAVTRGESARAMAPKIGVTHIAAWRIAAKIRKAMMGDSLKVLLS